MLPESLEKIVNAADYVDYDFRIKKIDFSTGTSKVEFAIHDTEGSNEQTIVLMTISNNVDYFIAKDDFSVFSNFQNDHPLLWRFSDTQCELYTTGQTNSIKELFFDLYTIHHSLFGSYLALDPRILSILENGHGLFQKGSKKLLKMYAQKLNEYGIKTSVIGGYPGSLANTKILFLGGSYFIGTDYKFEVIE